MKNVESFTTHNLLPNVFSNLLVFINFINGDKGQNVLSSNDFLFETPIVLHPGYHENN